MNCCPNCGRRLPPDGDVCTSCAAYEWEEPADSGGSAPTGAEPDPSRVAIARFQNGAEAGYFADELSRTTGIDVEVLARERFDGVHATWAVDYLLLADPADAAQAAQSLQSLVQSSDDDAASDLAESPERGELPSGVWIPLILTLAAGSIACWGVERAVPRPRPRAAALVDRDPRIPPNLWHVLGATRGPWIQQTADGAGRRELLLDGDHQTATLREDHDGDGTFEREWRFDWRE